MAKEAKKSASKRRPQAAKSNKTVKPAKNADGLTPFPMDESQGGLEVSQAAAATLPSVWKLSRDSLRMLLQNLRVFIPITAIYIALSLILVQSAAGNLNIANLHSFIGGGKDRLLNGLITFEWLVTGTGAAGNAGAGVLNVVLLLTGSLAIVWALRQCWAGVSFRARDAWYKGMYPFVPVILLTLLFIAVLLPLIVGLGVFNLVLIFGFAEGVIAKILWAIPALGLVILSLWLITPVVMSLYIATLPNMEPMAALKAGKELVQNRRWTVLRKLLFVPLALLVIFAVIMVPALLTAPLFTPWLLFLLNAASLPVIHSYLYNLYRELLA